MNNSPFIAGGPLTDDHADVYIEREADQKIYEHLAKMDYVMVIEPLQQGKTSLFNHMIRDSRYHNVSFIYLDLTTVDSSSAENWYRTLCTRIKDKLCDLDTDTIDTDSIISPYEWFNFLKEVSKLALDNQRFIVLVLDEIGMAKFPGATEFFSNIRAAFNARQVEPEFKRLAFILSGVFHPNQLINDESISPFNIAHKVELEDFTEGQVLELVRNGNWSEETSRTFSKRIHYWTNGQPYLTQKFCSYLFTDRGREDVDSCVKQFNREDRIHLPRVFDSFVNSVNLRNYLSQILGGNRYKYNPIHAEQEKLRLAGAIKTDAKGFCVIRNRIYEQTIKARIGAIPSNLAKTKSFFLTVASTIEQIDIEGGVAMLKISRWKTDIHDLNKYDPILVLVADDSLNRNHIRDLVRRSTEPRNGSDRIGLLVYEQPFDALVRSQILIARIEWKCIIIPIPFAEMAIGLREGSVGDILSEYSRRYLPGANLFDDRLAIADTFTFFGRDRMLNKFKVDLTHHQSIGLFGLRKSGKTSVLLQLKMLMREHPVVYIDLQAYSDNACFGVELFDDILKQLSPESHQPYAERSIPEGLIASDFTNRFLELTEKLLGCGKKMPVVCILDEIERIMPAENDFSEKIKEFNTFFGTLRAISQRNRRLSLIVADVYPACNRINDWGKTGVSTNPVFNFFKEEYAHPFPLDDTKQMIEEIGKLMGRKFEEDVFQRIQNESGGYPYISRQLASLLHKSIRRENITPSNAESVFSKALRSSRTLNNYYNETIQKELKKQGFEPVKEILDLLACAKHPERWVKEKDLIQRLISRFEENRLIDALQWMENMGLTEVNEEEPDTYCRISSGLLYEWSGKQMTEERKRECAI
jgi:hypothetical protein